MDLLEGGVAWLLDQLEEGASTRMIYRRGALSVGVSVTRGKTEYQTHDDQGNIITEFTDASFTMRAANLILGGSITEPEPGDRLEQTTPEGTRYYEVMPHGNLRHFSRDATGQMLKIHTKLVKTT